MGTMFGTMKRVAVVVLCMGLVQVDAVDRTVSPGEDIQSAIDAVASSGGGTVSLSAGTYVLSSSIQMKSNVTLEGVGTATRLELPLDATYAMIVDDGTEPCVNMTVRNMQLDGNIPESKVSHDPDYSDPQGGCLGIFFDAYTEATYHQNVVLENLEIHNTVDGCHMKGVDGGYWNNVYFHHNGIFYWPGHNSYLRRVKNYVVRHSRFEDSYNGSGINCSWSENLTFTNCAVIRSEGRGIRNAASDGFVVQDCYIIDCGDEGIIANSEGGITTSNIDFRRNYVARCGTGIQGGANGVAYDNNSFDNSGDDYNLGSAVVVSNNISESNITHSFDSNAPYGGSAQFVPGQIEAEAYDLGGMGVAYYDTTAGNAGGALRTDDVDIVACSEGGYALTALEAGEWLIYTIRVAVAGKYSFDMHYAADADAAVRFARMGLDITGDVVLPATGGSDTWATVKVLKDISLDAGEYSLRIYVSDGGFQFNHFTLNLDQIESVEGTTLHIEAESRVAEEGTDLEACSDTDGGQNVSYISNTDWCQYDEVVLGAGGSIQVRVACPSNKPDCAIEVWLDSLSGTRIATVDVPETGGWQTWETVEVDFPALAGQHPLFLKFVEQGSQSGESLFNLNWLSLVLNPVEYEAEHFSAQSGVSLEGCSDVGGGTNVANINPNDWCRFDDIFMASNAVFYARVARPADRPDGMIEIRANDPDGALLGRLAVPETGGWQTYETIGVPLNVNAGTYSICLKFVEDGSATGRYLFNLNRFSITPSSVVSPPEHIWGNAVAADRVDVTWESVTNATSYTVKRSTESGGIYSVVAEETPASEYSDIGVLAGTNYFYVVTAQYGSAESGNSQEASVVPSNPIDEHQYSVGLVAIVGDGSGGNTVSFKLEDSQAGHSYRLQSSDSLVLPDWQDAGDLVLGNGEDLNITASLDSDKPHLFYRLSVWRQ